MEEQINLPEEEEILEEPEEKIEEPEEKVIDDFEFLSEPMSHGASIILDTESAVDQAVLIRSAQPVKFVLVRN